MTIGLKAVALLALAVAACAPGAPGDNTAAASLSVEGNGAEIVVPEAGRSKAVRGGSSALNLAPDGLTLVLQSGAARQLAFGVARDAALRAVTVGVGEPTSRTSESECDGGPAERVEFEGGLGLLFAENRFIGWDLGGRDDGRFTTAAGIGLGSTRQDIESVIAIEVEQTALGNEFHSGPMSGLLSTLAPSGVVTALWAGTTCIAR